MYLIGKMTNIEAGKYSNNFTISDPQLLHVTFDDSMQILNYIADNHSCVCVRLNRENIIDIIHCIEYEKEAIRIVAELSGYAQGWVDDENVYGVYSQDTNHCINNIYYITADNIFEATECVNEYEIRSEVFLLTVDEVGEFIINCPDLQLSYRYSISLLEMMDINFDEI